ncbi:MAG: CRTAC1 family protein [Gemmatimonadales bacterium]
MMPYISRSLCTAAKIGMRRCRSYAFAVSIAIVGVMLARPAVGQTGTPPTFTDVARSAGIDFHHNFGAKALESILMTTGSGAALFDYDNDGWLDAFLVNGTNLAPKGKTAATYHALFHNRGDGTFADVTKAAGILEATYGQGCAVADYDGDGFVDLYITNHGPNQLYRNRGDGTFEDVTVHSGTGDAHWSTGAVFFDYDGDGDLDLYVSNYVRFKSDMGGVHSSALSKRDGFALFPGPRDYEPESDILYRNNGNGTFTDVSREAGLSTGGKGLTVVASDFDDDGDQDLFVANDATRNFLYENKGGSFVEVAVQAGVAVGPDGAETAAMGVDVADVDGDGDLDLYVTNMVFEFNNLYLNQGKFLFQDGTRRLGLDKDNYRHVGWATHFEDFNNDGYIDVFVANGHVVDYVEGFSQSITYPQQNMLFLGNERGRFKSVGNKAGRDFRRKTVSRGAAFGDYDNDGDVDILIANSGGRAQLLRNDTPKSDRWLAVRLKGRAPNTGAIGAKVKVRFGSREIVSEVRYAGSYLSSSDPTLHVGLRPGEVEGTVEVTWPSGTNSTHSVRAGRLVVIEEPR